MPAPKSSYLILFKGAADSRLSQLNEAERLAFMERWFAWFDSLVAAGHAVGGARLEKEGRTLRGSPDGSVRDGPFVETKEDVVGYFQVVAGSIEEAVTLARGCPGLPLGMKVDVRLAPDCRSTP